MTDYCHKSLSKVIHLKASNNISSMIHQTKSIIKHNQKISSQFIFTKCLGEVNVKGSHQQRPSSEEMKKPRFKIDPIKTA